MSKKSIANKEAAAVARSKENCWKPLAVELVHHLPGRLRLRSACLRGNIGAIENCRRQLNEITGVISIEANSGTGSFLLKYDPAVIPSRNIAEALAAHGIVVSEAATETASAASGGEAMISALKRLTLELLAERVMVAILGLAA